MVAVDIRPGLADARPARDAARARTRSRCCSGRRRRSPAGSARSSDVTEIEYFCTAPYNPAAESGIRWDDPALGIPWPVADPQLSAKDAAAGTLADWLARPESAAFGSPPGA